MQVLEKSQIHPCYDIEASKTYGRIHLPVIKTCNISCNYCSRDFNCPDENRPGVTNEILEVENIYNFIQDNLKKYPNIKIIGIAGPGDVFAEPDIFYESFKIVKKYFPELKTCFCTNGFGIIDNFKSIKELDIDYITVTVNTLSPETASKIHPVKDVEDLINRQIEGIKMLKKTNALIKINSVFLPEINEKDLIDVAKFAGQTGVFAQNIIPFYPVKNCVFKNMKLPSFKEVNIVRNHCFNYVKQLSHCKQCRADAVGYI